MKRLFLLTIVLFACAGGTFWYLGQGRARLDSEQAHLTASSNVNVLLPAAKAGNQKAQYELAGLYETGYGVPKNLNTAFKWYKKSAEKGYPEARYKLGWLYANGQGGVRQDYYRSAKWYRVAAIFNDHTASQFRLGELYFNGRGVEQDYGKAIHFYTQAAKKGHAAAQYLLGAMYMEGWGVPQNYIQAYMWLKRAAPHQAQALAIHNKYDPVLKLKQLLPRMNNYQIGAADKRLANLKARR